jgi:D-alanyl-D-alanine carboxypeptidase
MFSTLGDLEEWAKAFATGRLLSASMQQERLAITAKSAQYGFFSSIPGTPLKVLPARYGLGVLDVGGWLGKDGGIYGYEASEFYLQAKRATIVVLANLSGGIPDAAATSIVGIVLPH